MLALTGATSQLWLEKPLFWIGPLTNPKQVISVASRSSVRKKQGAFAFTHDYFRAHNQATPLNGGLLRNHDFSSTAA
jgi:hypothetical protein